MSLRSWFTGLTLSIAVVAAACAPAAAPPAPSGPAGGGAAGWDQTVAAAKQEGKVVVVTHTDLFYRNMMADFQKAFPGVEVEHVAIRPSEFAPKLLTEQQNALYSYDVWLSPTSNMVTVALPAGALQSMDPFLKLPEVVDAGNYRGGKLLWATTVGNAILLDRGTVDDNVWVNRDVLPASQFNSIDQLVSPALKGKVAIRSLDAPHGGSLTLAGFLHSKGMPWITQLMVDQQPQYIDNARLLTQNLINGKVAVAIGTDNPTLDQCMVAGGCKNLEQVRGYEYFLGSGAAVLKNAPHPNGTSVFLNWYFSKAGRESFMKATLDTTPPPFTSAQTIRKDVEPHKDAVASGSMPDYEHLEKYSLQGMEQGNAEMDAILSAYKKLTTGGR